MLFRKLNFEVFKMCQKFIHGWQDIRHTTVAVPNLETQCPLLEGGEDVLNTQQKRPILRQKFVMYNAIVVTNIPFPVAILTNSGSNIVLYCFTQTECSENTLIVARSAGDISDKNGVDCFGRIETADDSRKFIAALRRFQDIGQYVVKHSHWSLPTPLQ